MKYVPYTVVDKDGLIVRQGTSKHEDLQYIVNPETEELVLDNPIDINSRWVEGAWISIPPRPSYPVMLNKITNTWEDLRNLSQLKQLKWEEIKRKRTELENVGVTWNGLVFDSDEKSQLYLSNAILLAQNTNSKIPWILKNNTAVELTADQLIEVRTAISAYLNSLYNTSQSLRNMINSANSMEELNQINWPN